MDNTIQIHSIESFGTHDGPGIRLVVFLQGCNLKCNYCQNPDTIQWKDAGKVITHDEIVERALKMKSYFRNGGGITFSGGEPMLQSKQLIPLFKQLQQEGIHTNIDTNGTIWNEHSQELTTMSDLMMYDVKHTSPTGFTRITGKNGLNNLLKNVQLREDQGKTYWLRYVLVPGYTDSDENLQQVIYLFGKNRYLSNFELINYHTIGKHKWEMLNWEYELNDVKENTEEQIQRAYTLLKDAFPRVTLKE